MEPVSTDVGVPSLERGEEGVISVQIIAPQQPGNRKSLAALNLSDLYDVVVVRTFSSTKIPLWNNSNKKQLQHNNAIIICRCVPISLETESPRPVLRPQSVVSHRC